MSLSLYDTLTQRKAPFVPDEPGHARIYVCGPTVYDFAHVGHARCYVIYDVLVRHLRANGLKVTYVRNITDIDDKILNRSKENGEDPDALSRRFTEAFWEDMKALGNQSPDIEPKVSDHLPQIFEIIETLIQKGAAYASQGDVYYSVESFVGYGKLSHRTVDALLEGGSGRVGDEEKKKRAPADFALWKGAPETEWGWKSPWGFGRPGWHIECSAMGKAHLGETLDLHGGGLDLVFPHHENEIAQSEAASGKPLARHWMHNGFVEVDKTKMSKSLGNFFTAREIFGKYEPEALRYAMLTVHYRSPLHFDFELDAESKPSRFPLFDDAERRVEYVYTTRERLLSIDPARIVDAGEVPAALTSFAKDLASALDDDLNMPIALAHASEMLKQVNELVETTRRKKGTVSKAAVAAAEKALLALGAELGVGQQDPSAFLERVRARRVRAKGLTEADIDQKIEARKAAREAKDFKRADEVRDELVALGVELMDGAKGTTWRML